MSELKPCPFCGGKAHVSRDHCPDEGGIFLFVKCHSCRSQSGEKYHSKGNDCPQTYAEVRDKWNTRAAPTPSAALELPEVKAVQDALEALMDALDQFDGGRDGVLKVNARTALAAIRKAQEPTP